MGKKGSISLRALRMFTKKKKKEICKGGKKLEIYDRAESLWKWYPIDQALMLFTLYTNFQNVIEIPGDISSMYPFGLPQKDWYLIHKFLQFQFLIINFCMHPKIRVSNNMPEGLCRWMVNHMNWLKEPSQQVSTRPHRRTSVHLLISCVQSRELKVNQGFPRSLTRIAQY